jgi:NAD(P)-dependent dehydrogenase (short-subunit alcohol dehydrogenase family)
MDDVRGRRALVTGGNRGIGLAVVRMLADLGLEVLLGCRDIEAGAAVAASVGSRVTPVRIDVTDRASVRSAGDELAPDGVDVLVNNAGINPRGSVSAEQVDLTWQTNTLGTWRVTQAFLPPMRERRWGRIVNVSSEVATDGHESRGGIYRATKVAMNAMTRALAEDLTGTGILVNAISPGWCRSDMGGAGAPRTAEQGASSIVWGVTLADGGPTGGYFQDGAPLPW